MSIVSKNPFTNEVLKTFDPISDQELLKKIVHSYEAYQEWRRTSFKERSELMLNLASLLKKEKEALGTLITQEMGKPIVSSIGEVEKCASVMEYYANEAERMLAPEKVETEARESYIQFDPIGPVLAVMPWNYPFWQVMRFVAPALMAGNTGLLKHASNVPQCSLAIEDVIKRAGYPEGVFQSLLITSGQVESVLRHEYVKAATLTGSEVAGSIVASQAGSEIKKTVLELGGSDPFIVLEDSNLEFTCETGVNARLQNMGQSCIAAKRFIVVDKVYDDFLKIYTEKYKKLVIGDPMLPETNIGPLSSKKQLETIEHQVNESIKAGAKVAIGGTRHEKYPNTFLPTILYDVMEGMTAYHEEIFGPVAAVIRVKDDREAINVANSSPFGLGASVWTKNVKRAKQIATELEAGSVFINSMVKSHPKLPFGGTKKSGYGRELSHYGIKEFVNIKTVYCA